MKLLRLGHNSILVFQLLKDFQRYQASDILNRTAHNQLASQNEWESETKRNMIPLSLRLS
jgi:hypothetical protein